MEQGRKDDLWSLIYVLVELHAGLPWRGITVRILRRFFFLCHSNIKIIEKWKIIKIKSITFIKIHSIR